MSFSFPGAKTYWASVSPRMLAPSDTFNFEARADTESTDIVSKIKELRTEAQAVAALAITHIDACAAFSAAPIDVTYAAPAYVPGGYNQLTISTVDTGFGGSGGSKGVGVGMNPQGMAPGMLGMLVPGSSSGGASSSKIKTIKEPSAFKDSTEAGTPSFKVSNQPTPSTLGTMPAAPVAPSIDDLDPEDAPTVDVTVTDIEYPDAPDTKITVPALSKALIPDKLKIDAIKDKDIQKVLEKLKAAIEKQYQMPPIPNRFPEILVAVGQMLSESSPIHNETLKIIELRATEIDNAYTNAAKEVWSRRGLVSYADAFIAEYTTKETKRMTSQRTAYMTMIKDLWKDDQYTEALKIGAMAHGLQMDMLMARASIEFNALFGTAEAQLELIKSAEYAYKAAMVKLEVAAANLTAEYAKASSSVDLFNTQVDIKISKADMNRARASLFEANESVKSARMDAAEVEKMADVARAKNYESRMKQISAKAEMLTLGLETYKGDVAAWGAKLIERKTEFDRYKAAASLVKAENRSKVASLSVQEAENAVDAAKTMISAAEASIEAGEEIFAITTRAASMSATDFANAKATSLSREASVKYATAAGNEATRLMGLRAQLAGIVEENQAASAYFTAAAEAAGRAADLTQTSNLQLSEAYATAQEAAGRAAAAIETGRLSGWNASATISASGALEHSYSNALSGGDSYSTNITEANNEVGEMGYD